MCQILVVEGERVILCGFVLAVNEEVLPAIVGECCDHLPAEGRMFVEVIADFVDSVFFPSHGAPLKIPKIKKKTSRVRANDR